MPAVRAAGQRGSQGPFRFGGRNRREAGLALAFSPWKDRFGADAPLFVLRRKSMNRLRQNLALFIATVTMSWPASADPADPDLIFRKSTTFKLLTPNDKLAVYGIDDPLVDGVACHYTTPERGGLSGALGLAEQTSDVSLSCRQYGPIKFKGTFEQGDVVFSERRSLIFKKMQIVRGCDTRRNILVYMTYSDKLIEGSPKNSTSTVPIQPWGSGDNVAQKCADFVR
jgi:CreA protein